MSIYKAHSIIFIMKNDNENMMQYTVSINRMVEEYSMLAWLKKSSVHAFIFFFFLPLIHLACVTDILILASKTLSLINN